jgi:putative ABC transport system permease protein
MSASWSAKCRFVGEIRTSVTAVTRTETRAAVLDETRGPSTMLRIFWIFAVLALSFVVAATITNHATALKREIGLLKSAGITPRPTTTMLLAQLLAMGIPASVVGIAIGVITTRCFQWSITELLDSSAVTSAPIPLLIGISLAVQVLVVACAVLPAYRAGRTRIVDAIASSPRQTAGGASVAAGSTSANANLSNLPRTRWPKNWGGGLKARS